MCKGLSARPIGLSVMGAFRPDPDRRQSRVAEVFPVFPDAGSGVRVGEEGPPQQNDGQDDKSDSDSINHGQVKAQAVPKVKFIYFS
ncbi:MAG: hypothetical protein H0S80_14865 [Desulfovibrionaceae bacterium]|nr:hypothetical protein [Desulfovibrionaceae bacterium]